MKVRYIRESMNGNNTNTGCHWLEIQALNYDGINVALNKEVTTKNEIADGKLDMVTDGDYSTTRNYLALKNTNLESTSLTIDLKTIENIDIIKVWHYYGESNRKYNHILLETSIDGIEWTKIFDSDVDGEYIEASEGKTHKLPIEEELKELDDSASLNEVIAFYEKYIESNKQNKKMLKNILTSKNIECEDDKMLSLINEVGNIVSIPNSIPGDDLTLTKKYTTSNERLSSSSDTSASVIASHISFFNGGVKLTVRTSAINLGVGKGKFHITIYSKNNIKKYNKIIELASSNTDYIIECDSIEYLDKIEISTSRPTSGYVEFSNWVLSTKLL